MIVRITRVKVGNRQAPQQHQKPHPKKVGFLRLRAENSTRASPLSKRSDPLSPQTTDAPVRQLRHTTASTNERSEKPSPAFPDRIPKNYACARNFCASFTQ
jgi:hypothetical protein